MISAQPNLRSTTRKGATEKFNGKFAGAARQAGLFDDEVIAPGSYNDTSVIRHVLIHTIKTCGKTREYIAETMSYLLGREVTVAMLNAFTAESRDDRRWPAEFDRAFCKATGDNKLLACRAERAGLYVIDENQRLMMELGRQILLQERAAAKIVELHQELEGVSLG